MSELLGGLMMPPESFWRLTLKELDAIIRGRLGRAGQDTPPSRRDISDLMARFPDITPPNLGA